ncbi:MAG TPA: BatA domain-containing protein [Pirellulaceae bacterium]|nr:BatA domain-containing protein [Pirellulaceae bacterium]
MTWLIQLVAPFLTNPALFLAGAAAVSIPIIIHLLNKRKFKIVDWAAMEFLLDADKKNRRRIRLENLLLLLLRCLAVLLLALLLGRPFIPTSMAAGLIDAAQFERVVLLDDSLSMQARLGNESAFEIAKKRLTELTRTLADDRSDNSLTLLLTSNPDQPQFNATHLGADSIDEINAAIDKLEPGDGVANIPGAMTHLADYLSNQPANVNRVVYLFTDLRRVDWKTADGSSQSPLEVLKDLSKSTSGCFVIDAGDSEDRNLAVTAIRPEGTLVAGVASRFDVSVTNFGSQEARDVQVKFSAGDALPVQEEIDRIGAGETISRSFTFAFAAEEETQEGTAANVLVPRRVKVELTTARQGEDDRLPPDSAAYYPARLVRGIPVLIVDGDPSAAFGKAESFYLRRALSPQGPVPSGVVVDVVTENELESLTLDKYQVIVLANVYRLGDKTAENLARLEKWTDAGGGLVIMPGDQIDEVSFNDLYYRDGAGPSPLKLEKIQGDETEEKWVNFKVEQANHDVLKIFSGQNNPFLDNVKTFRWWGASVKKEQLGTAVSVPCRFTDVDDSPAFAEKRFGKGRVLAAAFPADADWSNWTSDPSYIVSMQEFVRYMSGDRGDRGLVRVGETLKHPLDLTLFDLDASLEGPKERKANLQAAPEEGTGARGQGTGVKGKESGVRGQESGAAPLTSNPSPITSPTTWLLEYPQTDAQGFYEMKLHRREGGLEPVLFAANVDPVEGDLRRVDLDGMKKELAGTNVQIVAASAAADLAGSGSQTELWWYLLWAAVAVLCGEQVLAWFFGRSR